MTEREIDSKTDRVQKTERELDSKTFKTEQERDLKAKSRKRKNFIMIASAVITVLVVLSVVILAYVLLRQSSSEEVEESGICETEECVKLGAKMKALMKPEINPCDDFFEYSCGNYSENAIDGVKLEDTQENLHKFIELLKNYQAETKSEKIAMVFLDKCKKTRSDSALNEDIWEQSDLTELLIEVAKVEPVRTGFIHNEISVKLVNQKNVLSLVMQDGIESHTVNDLSRTASNIVANDSSLLIMKKAKVVENLKKFEFVNLEKYMLGLLPEENRDEFKGLWDADILENEFIVLEEVFKKVGVHQIREVLKKKWKNELEHYLFQTSDFIEGECFWSAQKLFGGTFAMILIKRFASLENVKKSERLFEDLRAIFKEILNESTLLDDHMKSLFLKELDDIKSSIGIPDEHKDVSNIDRMYARIEKEQKVEDQSYLTLVRNILKMNSEETFLRVARAETITYSEHELHESAYYMDLSHRISVPAIVMNFLNIHPNLPKWNTIASIGFIFAHAMGHAFDADRIFLDSVNVPYPMSLAMRNGFDQRIDCIVQKYSEFKFTYPYLGGELTKQEDSADIIGFNVAYRLFKRSGGQRKLVGFENQTMDQTFFQRMAYNFCGKRDFIAPLRINEYSANKCRVNGMMSNSVDFARAFGCSKYSPMNPEEKCTLF